MQTQHCKDDLITNTVQLRELWTAAVFRDACYEEEPYKHLLCLRQTLYKQVVTTCQAWKLPDVGLGMEQFVDLLESLHAG